LACLLGATLLHGAELVTIRDPSQPPVPGGNGDSSLPLPSADGRYVLFTSDADNLVAANTNATPAVAGLMPLLNAYLRDRSNAVTILISVNLGGTNGGNWDSFPVGISTNGRYVLFETGASDLIAGDTNNASDVLMRDMLAGTNILVSAATNGLPGNDDSDSSVMTPDGRYVAFVSAASNLVADDTNGIRDVFVRDLLTGTTALASVGAQSASSSSEAPQITPDGRYVAFVSTATNLVSGIPPAAARFTCAIWSPPRPSGPAAPRGPLSNRSRTPLTRSASATSSAPMENSSPMKSALPTGPQTASSSVTAWNPASAISFAPMRPSCSINPRTSRRSR
jgi:Tol biopolymer transport system component